MKTLLVIKSSLFNGSGQSSKLVDRFAASWQQKNRGARVVVRDLAADPVAHLSAEAFQGFALPVEQRSPAQHAAAAISDSLIAELKQADAVAIGLPMYNFTVPSTFKAWMDHVARVGVSFEYTENGPRGLLESKPVYVFAARGGQYQGTEADTQTGLVRTFLGFIGLADVEFVYAEGLGMGEEAAQRALAEAGERIERLAA
ncbi:MAG: NAD(P)H-dependent oxidoreductase [Wenzhouxiangella sp.]|nr:NAD(P)H-dependent oxidoreductase [Wenzhouxiangella sp.]MCH8478355.1 NAD(P)H-dependent oxidoreductase [Wenzhouxiangella sp.]TVR94552.1 MAG: FMN-dependent NADH-azoreductase [Wenzhouxiangellaceae bacterium]